MSASFVGLQPWPDDIDIIECIVEGDHLVDLYNFGRFATLEVVPDPAGDSLAFLFDFDPNEAELRGLTADHVTLTFSPVTHLSLSHVEPWEGEAARQVEG